VFAVTHESLKETDAFMPPSHVHHGRCNMQNEEELLEAVHILALLLKARIGKPTETAVPREWLHKHTCC
jgi:hypothetical protein